MTRTRRLAAAYIALAASRGGAFCAEPVLGQRIPLHRVRC